MGVVTTDLLALTLAGLDTRFDAAYNFARELAMWPRVATEVPTTLPIQNYGFLGRGAVMEEFRDRAREQEVNQFNYSLADKVYKGMLTIDRTTLEDDQYGLLNMRVDDLGREPHRFWNQLAYEGLAKGFTTLCYDGQYFFDTDHSEGSSGTQVNKGTAALDEGSLSAAETAMMGFVDDKGIPMEILPDTLVVGPKNKKVAWELTMSGVAVIKADTTSGRPGTDFANYWQGKYNVVVSPYLRGTYDDYWFLLDTSKVVKPVVMQSRSNVPFTTESDMLDGAAKMREKYNYAVRGRFVQGYGLWQTAYGAIL